MTKNMETFRISGIRFDSFRSPITHSQALFLLFVSGASSEFKWEICVPHLLQIFREAIPLFNDLSFVHTSSCVHFLDDPAYMKTRETAVRNPCQEKYKNRF